MFLNRKSDWSNGQKQNSNAFSTYIRYRPQGPSIRRCGFNNYLKVFVFWQIGKISKIGLLGLKALSMGPREPMEGRMFYRE